MKWKLEFLPEALNDLEHIDNSLRKPVLKGILKVSQNPLPKDEGGYGTPLGNKFDNNLTGLFKIKFLKYGIRVVYSLERSETSMKVVVVSARADGKVYDLAAKRIDK